MAAAKSRMSDSQADYMILRLMSDMLNDLAQDKDGVIAGIIAELPTRHPEDTEALCSAAECLAHEMTVRALSLYDRNERAIARRARNN